jgi:2-methylisocitrate lyase-like PEP mutase family enzyme
MSITTDKALQFSLLHNRDKPLILSNVWDAGSTKIVEGSGAKAIATSSWAIAASHGYQDGELMPFEAVLNTVKEIIAATILPVSVDFESGYGTSPLQLEKNLIQLINCGVIGINFEDFNHRKKVILPVNEQKEKIAFLRTTTNRAQSKLFINARTDIFLVTEPADHDENLLAQALKRAETYKEAGADSFFAPGLIAEELIEKLCQRSPLPINIMAMPNGPSLSTLIKLKVARISYGPWPYNTTCEALQKQLLWSASTSSITSLDFSASW